MSNAMHPDPLPAAALQAQVLHGVLPYLQSIHDKVFVVVCEGSVLTDPTLRAGLGRDVALLHLVGLRLVLLPGGTDAGFSALDHLHQDLIGVINQHGCRAVGLTAADGGSEGLGAGLVQRLHAKRFIPVVMPVGETKAGSSRREAVDADALAADTALQLGAEKLLFLLDDPGALDAKGRVIADATEKSIRSAVKAKGVAPAHVHRLATAARFVAHGGKAVHLLDGRRLHALLLEVLGNGYGGTTVLPEKAHRFLEDSGRYLK